MKGFHVADTVVIMRLGGQALIYFLDSLVALMLQIGSIGEIPDNPSK